MFDNRLAYGAALGALLVLSGCARKEAAPEDPTAKNLRLVVTAYLQYVTKNQQAPHSARDLTPILQELGVADPEGTLRSDRDHEPFVILWNVEEFSATKKADKKEKTTRPRHFVLAYEKSGSDGYRFVGFSSAYVAEASDEEMTKASFPSNHKFP
ncbi:hypothetical protein AYO40_01540 [Planctomycetaceae bacterium SCGC AG-212-D15]|nr:hypothetical protein AYO40_01540 [Planctomycetaceae bacterium SCGC AG-212-D15]